jgi:uncharacterized membrane protein YccF (DUF307 family)
MRLIGNILWFVLGGVVLALLWFLAGLLCCITIVGIPIGLQCFKFASLMLWPFGRDIDYSAVGAGSMLVNLLWIMLLGWELALAAAAVGVFYMVTIIGIPFGLQAFKFVKLALLPFGARIVDRRG